MNLDQSTLKHAGGSSILDVMKGLEDEFCHLATPRTPPKAKEPEILVTKAKA